MELFLQSPETRLAGAALAFLLALNFVFGRFKPSKNAKNPSPPEAGRAWPIIGHLPQLLRSSQPPHVTFAGLADKYGPAFIFKLGQHPALVVSNWELVKELYTTKDLAVLTRPKCITGEHLAYDYAMFGFSQYGPYWREIRKLISIELLSARRLELLKHIRVSETETSIKELYNLWTEKRKNSSSSSGSVLVEMNKWFGDLTLNAILRMVVGKRYSGSVNPSEEKEARRCQEVLRELFHLTGLFLISDLIPLLRWLNLGGYETKMKQNFIETDQIAEDWLKEHRRKKEFSAKNNSTDHHHQDFMDVMISLMEGAEIAAGYDGDTIIKATCINLIAGGSDTTSVTLTWALTLIINNPGVLKKVQEELEKQVGKERQVNESDINNLVYLQAIIKETLRLYPAAALGGAREFTEDCTVGGYQIQKGTRLLPNLWKLHRDPNVWDEPLKFKPERFLTTNKDIDMKGHHFVLIPFSSGRRICPGMNLGIQMLHLVLANVLHAFDFSNPSDEAIDMTETAGLVNHKGTPLPLLIAPRLSPTLY